MSKLKSLSVALLALGLTAPAFAASVIVPSQQGGFKVGVDALYLRATNSDLGYATLFSFDVPSLTSTSNKFIDPSYNWGFYAQVGYLFPCTGNDLTVGYTYLRTSETDSVVSPGLPEVAIVPIQQILVGRVPFTSAQGKAAIDLSAVDLEAGQRFTTGAYDMRMFAGVRYAKIDYTLGATGNVGVITSDGIANQQFSSNFRGVGPRVGVDGRYCLRSGFGLDANFSTALLVGHVDGNYSASTVNIPRATTFRYTADNGSRMRVVPVLEAKLGADYTRIINRSKKSSIMFEAGYQVTNYFNAVDHVGASLPVAPYTFLTGSTSDVAFDGPYLGVKYYA